jgi:hypothetical protein
MTKHREKGQNHSKTNNTQNKIFKNTGSAGFRFDSSWAAPRRHTYKLANGWSELDSRS